MDIREFRVGNLVTHPVFEIPCEVRSIAFNGLYIGDPERGCPLHISEFKPIILTEKWLVDFGGYRVVGWDDVVLWRFEEFYDDIFEVYEVKIKGATKYENPHGKIIEYVHTLQNAYYFHTLTGKELTLSGDSEKRTV